MPEVLLSPPDRLNLEITNRLQRELMEEADLKTTEEKAEWIQQNRARFREIVDLPEIIELYRQNPATAKERLKELLYGQQDLAA